MVDSCVEFKGMIGITQLSVLVKTEWWSPEYAGPRAISFLIAQIPLNVLAMLPVANPLYSQISLSILHVPT